MTEQLETKKVAEVPYWKQGFNPSPETLLMRDQIETLEPGEVLQFIVKDQGSPKETLRYFQKMNGRLHTAVKHVRRGFYRVHGRKGQLYVQRTE